MLLTYTTWFAALREFEANSFVLSLSVAVPIWPGFFILPVAFALASLVSALKLYLCLVGQVGNAEGAAFAEVNERGASS